MSESCYAGRQARIDTAERIAGANDPRPFDSVEDAAQHPGYTGYERATYGPGWKPIEQLDALVAVAAASSTVDSRLGYWKGIIWNEHGDAALVDMGDGLTGIPRGSIRPITQEQANQFMLDAVIAPV